MKSPERYRWVAQLGIQAAEALQYAHDRGIIHRDIKPANLLLDKTGTLWITDFGLARIEGAAELTMTGDLLGTLRYMSPEQAADDRVAVSQRTDVYALGAVLYELATGRPVVEGSERGQILQQIIHRDPPPLRQLDRRVPGDFDTIILKSLAKDQADRYETAGDMRDDLRRFANHLPIRARPYTAWQKARSWARRNSGLTLSALAALALVVLLATLSAAFALQAAGRTRVALAKSDENLKLAQNREREMQLALYVTDMPAAQRAWSTGDLMAMRQHLERHLPRAAGDFDRRGFEWHYLWRLCNHASRVLKAHDRPIHALALSADGRWIATGDDHGHVKIWELSTLAEWKSLPPHQDGIRLLFFADADRQLVSVGAEGGIIRWDPERGQRIGKLVGQPCQISATALSPDRSMLAAAGSDLRVRIWNVASGELLHQSEPRPDYITSLSLHSADDLIVTGDKLGTIRGWNFKTGAERPVADPRMTVPHVMFQVESPRPYLIICATDNAGCALRLPGMEYLGYEIMHTAPVWGGDAVPGLLAFATTGQDGLVKVWTLDGGQRKFQLRRTLPELHATGLRVQFSPDRRWLAAASAAGEVTLTDLYLDGEQICKLAAPVAPQPAGCQLSCDGKLLVTTATTGAVQIWDAQSGAELSQVEVPTAPEGHWIEITPDNQRLFVGQVAGGIAAWDISDSARPAADSLPPELSAAGHSGRLSHDGKLLALSLPDQIVLFDLSCHEVVQRLTTKEPYRFAFSAKDDALVSVSQAGQLQVWSVADGSEAATLENACEAPHCLEASPNGRWLAVGCRAGINVYGLPALEKVAELRGLSGGAGTMSFSPDSRTLAVGSEHLRLWNTATWNEAVQFKLLDQAPLTVRFLPDGRSVMVADAGQVTTFSLDPPHDLE